MKTPESYKRPPQSDIAKTAVPACPVCEATGRQPLYSVREHEYHTTTTDAFTLYRCEECTAWYLDPRPAVSALGIIYPPNYYTYATELWAKGSSEEVRNNMMQSLMSWLFKKRIQPIMEHIPNPEGMSWLDVGCGNGLSLTNMKETFGMVGTGIDISEEGIRMVESRGFDAHCCRFEDFRPPDGARFDMVHSAHLIEHVESPLDYMRKVSDVLKPGGINAFVTPNVDTWEAGFFKENWGGLHVPRHWSMLNPASAMKLAEKSGFEFLGTHFSTNGTFWTWTFHSMLMNKIPDGLNDLLFPSDHRFVKTNPYNILRIGAFSMVDVLNVLLTKQSANMLVLFRKN